MQSCSAASSSPTRPLFAAFLRGSDPLATLVVGLAGYAAYLGGFGLPVHYALFLVAGALAIAALFPMFRLYEPQRGVSIIEELRHLSLAWLLLTGLVGGALFATKSGDAFSRVWVGIWLAGGFAATVVLRVSVRLTLQALRRRGHNLRHVAIVGAGTLGRNRRPTAGAGRVGRVTASSDSTTTIPPRRV